MMQQQDRLNSCASWPQRELFQTYTISATTAGQHFLKHTSNNILKTSVFHGYKERCFRHTTQMKQRKTQLRLTHTINNILITAVFHDIKERCYIRTSSLTRRMVSCFFNAPSIMIKHSCVSWYRREVLPKYIINTKAKGTSVSLRRQRQDLKHSCVS